MASSHVLRCAACNFDVPVGTTITLTRDQMRDEPPDVLFTTTEMLNRLLMDGRMRHLIGVGRGGMPIEVVLLDEVHTYEGTTGAQSPASSAPLATRPPPPGALRGLSATLREASSFFASLTGLPDHAVSAIEPGRTTSSRRAGVPRRLLRGDPHSGASVLSTTIQTAMLMRRVLDP